MSLLGFPVLYWSSSIIARRYFDIMIFELMLFFLLLLLLLSLLLLLLLFILFIWQKSRFFWPEFLSFTVALILLH